MLHHFAHRHTDGRWHAAYLAPGTGAVTSMVDCPTRKAAQEQANILNREQAHKARQSAEMAKAIEGRHIPKGFYTDDDAA